VRVVLDTNVLVSALFGSGLCEALVELLLESSGVEIVLSDHIIDEIREHAAEKFRVPEKELRETLAFLRRHATVVRASEVPPDTFSDPDDLPVLGTAIAGRAAALVTGDKGLLKLGEIQGIPIVSLRAFYAQLR